MLVWVLRLLLLLWLLWLLLLWWLRLGRLLPLLLHLLLRLLSLLLGILLLVLPRLLHSWWCAGCRCLQVFRCLGDHLAQCTKDVDLLVGRGSGDERFEVFEEFLLRLVLLVVAVLRLIGPCDLLPQTFQQGIAGCASRLVLRHAAADVVAVR